MRIVLYGFLVFLGVILFIFPLAIPIVKTSAEFSMFNTRWDGCSKFARLLSERGEIVPVIYPYNSVNLSKLEGVLIVVGPDVEFSQLEAEEVKKFLEKGGTLFIADDFGTANGLLKKLGLKAKFSTKPLIDLFYSKRIEFPVVVRIEDPELAIDVKNVTLNVPSAIVGIEGEIFSSKVSLVGESMGSYPIMAEVRYGKGRIIMISDPSLLINDMFERNKKFIENLVRYLGNRFYFDEAHHSDFNPYSITTVYIHRELDEEKALLIFIAVTSLAIFIESGVASKIARTFTISRKKEDIFDDLPDWIDREKLKKMIDEIKKGSKIGDMYGRKGVYRKSKKRS